MRPIGSRRSRFAGGITVIITDTMVTAIIGAGAGGIGVGGAVIGAGITIIGTGAAVGTVVTTGDVGTAAS